MTIPAPDDQPLRPRAPHEPWISPKLAGASAAAAVATLITWLVEILTATDLPPAVEGAIATIFAFLGGLFISDRRHKMP